MLYCPKCGNKIPKGAQYCSNCGVPIDRVNTENKSKLKNELYNSSFLKFAKSLFAPSRLFSWLDIISFKKAKNLQSFI